MHTFQYVRTMKSTSWNTLKKRDIDYHNSFRMLVILLLTVIICADISGETKKPVEDLVHQMNHQIPSLMKKYDIPGVTIAVIHGAQIVWTNAYGFADAEQKIPMTVDAVCRAESISKSVTAWGVMQLVDQGLVDLDMPVTGYLKPADLPESDFPVEKVTLRRLLSNSAGLPLGSIGPETEYSPGAEMPTVRDYLFKEFRLVQNPGSGFIYSNVGFNTLELVVQEVINRSFAEYMSTEILQPLGMEHSSYTWIDSFAVTVPTGYELDGTPVPPYIYPVSASGGLFSTVEDIARFVVAGMHEGETVLDSSRITALYEPEVSIPGLFGFVADAYGLGHFLEVYNDRPNIVWHGGQGHGWMTDFHAVPETGDGIVIFTNSQRSWPLIAHILNDWAEWSDIGTVKFGRIVYANVGLQAITGLLFLLCVVQIFRLVTGVRNEDRRFIQIFVNYRWNSLAGIILGVGIIGFLLWSLFQPYLFVTSIFPRTALLAAVVLFLGAVLSIVSALWPQK